MPQDETVSEAEVEAAARAISEASGGPIESWMYSARAALTAAAQVRERASHSDRSVPCPTCGFHVKQVERHPFIIEDEPDSGPDVLGERKGIIGNFDEK